MNKFFLFLFFLIRINVNAQNVPSLSFDEFNHNEITGSKGIVVVNFWATWCKPCIEEIPAFEKCTDEYKNSGIKIILANLDFNSQLNTSVKSFVQKKNIRSTVIHIKDTDSNSWIDKADKGWSGAIPATCIYKNGSKIFFKEGSLTYEELSGLIEKFIKTN